MWSREISRKDNSCLSLFPPARRGLSSTCGNRQLQHMRHLLSPHVPVLSAPHLILLLFSEVPVRYRGLSKHSRENH